MGVGAYFQGRNILLASQPLIIGRIEEDRFIMDCRTIRDEEFDRVASAISALCDIH